jgi:hypothetical protein
MRRFFSIFLLLLLLLTACAPGGGEGKCSKGVCVKIRSVGPLKKDSSIPIMIKAKSDKDQTDMYVILALTNAGTIEEAADKSDVVYRKNEGVVELAWKKKMQAKKEITITQNVRVEGPGDYTLTAMVILPSGSVVSEGLVLRITEEGGTEYVSDTPIPPGTQVPLQTVTPGPSPTFLPTDTALPLPTPVVAETTPTGSAYPAPTD